METFIKILRWVLHLLPLCLCVLGIFCCAGAMIEFQKLQAQMAKETDTNMDKMMADVDDDPLAAVMVLPMILMLVVAEGIAEAIGLALAMAMCLFLFFIGGGAFLIGLIVAICSKKAPLELRRAGILLNGLLLVTATAIYVCGYFT